MSTTTLLEAVSSISVAVKARRLEIVNLLLEKRAKINVLDKDYYTLLHIDAQYGGTEVVTLLLDKGAEINVRGGWHKDTPFHHAVIKEQSDMVALLRLTAGG